MLVYHIIEISNGSRIVVKCYLNQRWVRTGNVAEKGADQVMVSINFYTGE